MKKINILTGCLEEFKKLPILNNVPIFNGAVDTPFEKDKFQNLDFLISKKNGLIQLSSHPNIKDVYQIQTKQIPQGGVWKEHHIQFSELISKYNPKKILEIGGAHGYLARLCQKKSKNLNWTIVEPNPSILDKKIKTINSYFIPEKHLSEGYDCVVHSHVFEHFLNPLEISIEISKRLKKNGLMFASIPNLWNWVDRCQPNGLNFEHTYLLSKIHFEQTIQNAGFEIIESIEFGQGHSIFYVLINRKTPKKDILIENLYDKSLPLFQKYIKGFKDSVFNIRKQINKINEDSKIYIFGAHLFTQFLLVNKLDKYINLEGVLDNNPSKEGKRLYGSKLKVFNPIIIKDKKNPIVIVKAGNYTKEITEQLLEINKSSIIIS